MAAKASVGDDLIPLFQSIGLSQPKAAEAAKNPKSAAVLKELIERHGLAAAASAARGVVEEKQGVLIAALAGQIAKSAVLLRDGPEAEGARGYVLGRIRCGDLKSVDQVNAAVKYVEGRHEVQIDEADFDEQCGVGFSITAEELDARVREYVSSSSGAFAGWDGLSAAIGGAKGLPGLRWANPLELKTAVEKAFVERFGPKVSSAAKPKSKKDARAAAVVKKSNADDDDPVGPRKSVFEEGFLGQLHKPGENAQLHPHLREAHLAATEGKVVTRFPPEPNGYLHIGHSKAIFVDFGYAAHHGGRCYLRYDDTNPEAEEKRYFDSILEIVRWLGYEPWKVTYSSDYFDQLHGLAVELIKRDKAYVCHCTQEEIKIDRGEKRNRPKACVHRTRPVSESLVEFENMKNGKYRPKEANLRMKQDLEDGNPQMWDLTAYRVLDTPHYRTGDKWKIYPTYDFTHCLVDSMENISHSLCTVEFIASRQSYDWLCDALEVYKPRQSEFGRLNLEGSVMSKRKILSLVNEGYVRGWDDPRLYTLIALRRRGVPPGAIISFVSALGVSMAPSNIETARFEQVVRQYLENTVPRLLMVMRPLKVTITNLPEDYVLMIEKPVHPKVPELGTTTVPFTRTIYIERDDFRLEDSKDFFRLAPGKTVGLFQAPHPITCTSYKTDPESGQVVELLCTLEDGRPGSNSSSKKPKAFVQWVADYEHLGSPVRIDETRIFNRLFKSDHPPSDYKSDINPDSLDIVKGAMVEVGFWSLAKRSFLDARRESRAKAAESAVASGDATEQIVVGMECVRFQGLRIAYFALDKDSKLACLDEPETVSPRRSEGDVVVLNRIVSLKEDSGKSA